MKNKILSKIRKFFYYGNRNFADYVKFLYKAKSNGFEFVPLMAFLNKRVPNEKIIGLRHDVDSELNHALKIAKIEHDLGIKSTYFVLHTASYFYKEISSGIINNKLIKKLLYLQDTLGHEIGLHIDLMPIEIVYKKDPVIYVKNLIGLLREKGINIIGVAPHGNLFHHVYRQKYIIEHKEFNNNIFADPYIHFDVKIFNVDYEAYSLDRDIYYSDAKFIDNMRWDFSFIDDDFYKKNGRTIILTHTIHWAPSKMYYYTVNFTLTVQYFFRYLSEYIKYMRSK